MRRGFAPRGPSTLPRPPTEIIGRAAELATVTALVCDETVHLVTLLGPGGIGKTRPALEVARGVSATTAFDEVWFVDLAPLTDPDDWAQTIGRFWCWTTSST